ncbi:ParB/RepB/Spo0J family partition protein [Dictyoglomus thermophilum]|uniref:Stage 0 sporulation protein J n=1 Tax=Dictyoglomus thermophilum (strain ATCC 35947 / DSM 3960 / H-6-12) TaxID=309799 RepID=B5YBX9_DICT6|nr:ParB/RepB/Spo0J family partition protein [Dictyoglomus thermophilum]ACI20016.1 stage 0 sporulation protein J [Dictyoglomus thermophilum H-6-12]
MSLKKKGLGRGLEALIGEEENLIEKIPIEKIVPNPQQPRETLNPETLQELVESIKQLGLLQPILVRPKGDYYEIIAGERRYHAAKTAGLKEIPVIVKDIDDQSAWDIALTENLQREDLNPIEKAKAFQYYIETFKVTQEELAQRLSISRSEISNFLRLLQLPPEIQEEVRRGNLTYGHARTLLSVEDPYIQKLLAQKIIKEKLSVRETEELVKRRKIKDEIDIPEIRSLEEKMEKYLGTKVKIQPKSPTKGRITIEYKSLEQLEDIIKKFLD